MTRGAHSTFNLNKVVEQFYSRTKAEFAFKNVEYNHHVAIKITEKDNIEVS